MRRWAVTGPAGGGKSSLCLFFTELGAVIVDGDSLGHEILARQEIVTRISAEFGSDIVREGAVDRAALGSLVFADTAALDKLNLITHAPLAQLAGLRLQELEDERRHRLAVLEAAVYFLLPPVPGIELVINVTASETVRFARLTSVGGLSETDAWRRIEAQRSLGDGWAGADVVVTNDASLSALKTIAEGLWSRLED